MLAVFLLAAPHPVRAADKLTIAGVQGFTEKEAGTQILTEAYRRIGIEITIKRFPAERAIQLANKGDLDGDLQRIDGIDKKYPNLIQIQPALNFFEASAFSATHDFTVDGWESLRGYRIGIIRGMKFAETNTQGMDPVVVDSYASLLKMLENGRLDVGVLPRLNGQFQAIKWATSKVRDLEPPLLNIKLYHYIHRKNADLAPAFLRHFRKCMTVASCSRCARRPTQICSRA